METLEIKKDDAIKAHEKAKKSGKNLLENLFGKKTFLKEVTERIKTIEDVLEDNNTTQSDIHLMFANVPEHLKAQHIAELLCKSLNEGWESDWDNSNEYKYYPWFKIGSSGFRYYYYGHWHSDSNVSSRLCFKTSKLAVYAGEQFTDLYKQFMIIN